MSHSHSILNPEPCPGAPDLERVVCDFCGSRRAETLASLPPLDEMLLPMHRLGAAALNFGSERVDFVRCLDCGLVYMNPRLTEAAIARFYDTVYRSGISAGFESDQHEYVHYLWETLVGMLPQPGRVLDIGCGAGQFLHEGQARGWSVAGCELSQVAADRASAALKTPIFTGDFREAGFEPASFDVVSLLAVVEHLRAPVSCLSDAAALLKPGGVLLLVVPNVDSTEYQAARLLRQRWRGFIVEHLYNFTPELMARILTSLNLEVEQMTCWTPHARWPNPVRDALALLRSAAPAPPGAPAALPAAVPPLKPVSLPRRLLRQINNTLMDAVSKASEGRRGGGSLRGPSLVVWARRFG